MRQTPSFPPRDLVRARAALPALRDRTPACCQHHAPTHHSNPTFQGFNKAPCRLARDSLRRIHTYRLMALPMRRRLPSWAVIRCDLVACRSASRRHHLTRSPRPPKHSNLHSHHQYPAIMVEHHSQTTICSSSSSSRECSLETFHKASTPTSIRRVLHPLDLPRHRIQWGNR